MSILPGFSSAVLFNCGTFRQTLAALEKHFVVSRSPRGQKIFRFGKDIWNGEGVFKGITVHRYNLA